MRRAESVVDALRALGETGEAPRLAQRLHARSASGQNLVRIGLVANVPDELVGRRVEYAMQRYGELHDTQPGSQMTAGEGHDIDGFAAQLVGKLMQRLTGQRA